MIFIAVVSLFFYNLSNKNRFDLNSVSFLFTPNPHNSMLIPLKLQFISEPC